MIQTTERKEIKRAYFVKGTDDEYGWPVIAHSAKEAKKMAFGADGLEDIDFIDIRVSWLKDAKIDDLPYGIYGTKPGQAIEGLKRGLFGWMDYTKRPRCGNESRVSYEENYVEGGFYCDSCDGFERCPQCKEFKRYEDEELCENCTSVGD